MQNLSYPQEKADARTGHPLCFTMEYVTLT